LQLAVVPVFVPPPPPPHRSGRVIHPLQELPEALGTLLVSQNG
jgi:hypothetical protein